MFTAKKFLLKLLFSVAEVSCFYNAGNWQVATIVALVCEKLNTCTNLYFDSRAIEKLQPPELKKL